MSKKRYFDTNFGSDSWIAGLDKMEKYLFFYLITNDRMNVAGVYEIPLRNLAFESEFEQSEVIEMLSKMQAKVRYINGWIILRNAIKNQTYHNPKINKGITNLLDNMPEEFFEYIDIPKDFEYHAPEPSKQASLLEDQSRAIKAHEDQSRDSNNVIKLNVIKSNSNAGKPAGNSKEMTKAEKRNYAIAMEHEREQQRKAEQAKARAPSETAERMQARIRKIQNGGAPA